MPEKYVVVKGSGGAGLGDKVCALAAAILYGLQSERVIVVDWRDRAFGSQDSNLFPELFSLDGVPASLAVPETKDVAPHCWSGHLELSLDELRAIDLHERGIRWVGPAPAWDHDEAVERYSIDASRLDYKERVVVMWSGSSMRTLVKCSYERGVLERTVDASEMMARVVKRHLKPHAFIRHAVERFAVDNFDQREVVGVHYRKTDEAARSRTIPSHAQYIAAVDDSLRRLRNPLIFLATDNRSVQDEFVRRYGPDRVRWTAKWLPDAGAAIHMNARCPDGLAAARDALIDIGLLAGCDRLVLTGNSSFSSLAGWLSPTATGQRRVLFPDGGGLLRRAARRLQGLPRRLRELRAKLDGAPERE